MPDLRGALKEARRGAQSWRTLAAAAICIATVWASTRPVVASVLMGDVFESASGKILINLFGNHGILLDLVIPAMHEAEALDVVRLKMLREQRIHDLPILIRNDPKDFWSGPQRRSVQIPDESECKASYGESTTPPKYIGVCYLIEPGAATHEDLVTMMVALSELSPGVRRLDVKDPAAFRAARSAEIQRFRNLTLHFDPIWSPDGTRLLYSVWESSGIRFEILEPRSRTVMRLEPLSADMFTRPVWSGDGRFIAYASLRDDVRVFDTRTRATRAFRPEAPLTERHTLVFFEGTLLRFAFWDGTKGYEMYDYDAVRGELQRVASRVDRPAWIERAQEYGWAWRRHTSLSPVRSPTGQYVALFKFVDGQRRVELKTLR